MDKCQAGNFVQPLQSASSYVITHACCCFSQNFVGWNWGVNKPKDVSSKQIQQDMANKCRIELSIQVIEIW
jgi:hypothetical protein